MSGVLYEEGFVWVFILVTVFLGGGAAWLSGRAIALTWRPFWQVIWYMLLMSCAVRFLHFALFEGTLIAPLFHLVDLVVLIVLGSLGFRSTRTIQMTTQYPWLYERFGPLGWRARKATE